MYLIFEFQEEYKRLDRLCRDCQSTSEDISEYIHRMEKTPIRDRLRSPNWQRDYEQLKRVRWVRNQLAHEVGSLESDICTKEDLAFVQNFYKRILDGSDSLTAVRKAKEEEARILKEQAKAKEALISDASSTSSKSKSWWSRFWDALENFIFHSV